MDLLKYSDLKSLKQKAPLASQKVLNSKCSSKDLDFP